jgi:uncharacterized membrane protein
VIPFFVLVVSFILFRCVGWLGVAAFSSWIIALRAALFVMFLLTASAHWGTRRPDLIKMVPAGFTNPALLVTLTGILEILGAIGLLIPSAARLAATCLAVLLIVLFPANVRAAREHLTIKGQVATKLPLRTLMQVAFIAALLAAGWMPV